jgi:hypothetical protein
MAKALYLVVLGCLHKGVAGLMERRIVLVMSVGREERY